MNNLFYLVILCGTVIGEHISVFCYKDQCHGMNKS